MIKIQLTVPEQSFILEGETLEEARDNFDATHIDFYDEVLCDDCKEVIDSKNHCGCQQTKKEVESKLYVCPLDDCEYKTHWTLEEAKEKAEPLCPNDDEDLVPGCYACERPVDEDGRCNCTNKDADGL